MNAPQPQLNQQWLLARRPQGVVSPDDFKWAEGPIPEIKEGEVLVRNLYLSCDPTQRSWMAVKTYMPPVKLGDVMRAFAVGEVIESRDARFARGDRAYGLFGWQDYCAAKPDDFFPMLKVPAGVSLESAMSIFGLTGLTAYFGLLDVGQPKPGETVLVSGAAGATGSIAAQIAKILGCRVVGIAGGREKCDYLTRELGLDAAVDYKNENIITRLRETCPDGVHVFFDNVGGRILDAALMMLAMRARIVICGAIAGYSNSSDGPRNLMQLLVRRSRMEGFVMTDFNDRVPEALDRLSGWLAEGRIKDRCDVVEGLENAPQALLRLFSGENKGKQVVRIGAQS